VWLLRNRGIARMTTRSDGARGARGLSRGTRAAAGARIRSVRFRLDRSEQSFGALLGVEPDVVRAWERGEQIDRDALILIASATDTALEWLIAGLLPAEVEAIRAAVARRAPRAAVPNDEGVAPRRVTTSAAARPDGEAAAGPVSPAQTPSGRRPRGPYQ
jgi:transcriptional regulator with XRE-family HTH domain